MLRGGHGRQGSHETLVEPQGAAGTEGFVNLLALFTCLGVVGVFCLALAAAIHWATSEDDESTYQDEDL